MKAEKAVIKELNSVLTDQLTAINQFFLHARIFRHYGLPDLDSAEYARSMKAMKLADKLIQRVLFLEGLPNLRIPAQSCHRFHGKAATCSTGRLPPIPVNPATP